MTNTNTAFDKENKIVCVKQDVTIRQVSLISGGGSGHEPSFAGFVGTGLLSAAVAGTIFASPSAEQIRRCIFNRVDTREGVLVIVMNYTGDVLNFGMAVEKAKAAGLKAEMIIVADDAGVGRKQGGKVGRRGIAGTVLVHKIAGALAAGGASFETVHRATRTVADNLISIGASLSHVHVPGRADSDEAGLGSEEIEIGMGIHNEPGAERRKMSSLQDTVQIMLKYMLDPHDEDRAFSSLSPGDQCVLMINNLGGVSVLELGAITTEVAQQLKTNYKLQPVRIYSGTFMTSLNGLGFSITLLKLSPLDGDLSMIDALDAEAQAVGWPTHIKRTVSSTETVGAHKSDQAAANLSKPSKILLDPEVAAKMIEAGLAAVVQAEPEVTKYDTAVGDGDCGIGLKRGAEAISQYLKQHTEQRDVAILLDGIVSVVETSMDGTSGALYAIFLNALTQGVRTQSTDHAQDISPAIWSKALVNAMSSLSRYTPAKPGDRTLVDALQPFIDELEQSGDLQQSARAAVDGADRTKSMKASLGRTVYIESDSYDEVPDPGAYGLAKFLAGLAGV